MVADLLLNAKDNYIINFEANIYRLKLNRQSKSSTYKNVKIDQINLDLRPLEFNAKIINITISYGELILEIILSTSIKKSKN